MAFPKSPPFRSEENLEKIRNSPCLVCKRKPPSDPDHIRTRASGGGDELWNLQPLCRLHHTEKHQVGLKSFVARYMLPIEWVNGYPRRLL